MIPYIIFILCLLFCYWRKSPIGMLIVMILFAVLRYDTGWDYHSYELWVTNPSSWNNPETSRYSLFWRELFKVAHQLGFPHLAISLPNVVTYIMIYVGLRLLHLSKRQQVDALLVYATWYSLYLGSFSTIRQAIAMSFGFVAFACLQNKKYFWTVATYLIAVHLHTSAAVLILLLPIYIIREYLNLKWLLVSLAIVTTMLSGAGIVLESIGIVDMSKYSGYLKLSDNFGGKLMYLNIALGSYFVYTFIRKHNKTDIERQCYFAVLVSIFGSLIRYSMHLSNVFDRIFEYYIIFIILILLPSVDIFKERNILRPISVFLLVAFFFTYLIIVSGATMASSGFVPYKCILLN